MATDLKLYEDGNLLFHRPGDGSVAPPASGAVPPVETAQAPFADLGMGGNKPPEVQVQPNQQVFAAFTVSGGVQAKNIRWYGKPGAFFKHTSWSVFNADGTKVAGMEHQTVVGTLGYAIPAASLETLPDGQYSVGIATDGSGNMAVEFA